MHTYTFIEGETETESVGVNLLTAAAKIGIVPTRMDRVSNHYLARTPFNDRVTVIWVDNRLIRVKQFIN
jgi:hypothetical protein